MAHPVEHLRTEISSVEVFVRVTTLLIAAALIASLLWVVPTSDPAAAAADLSITPITWNVVGLKSNDVGKGPATFPVGARVCNTGDTLATGVTATGVTSSFAFTSTENSAYIRPAGITVLSHGDLPEGQCVDAYYALLITPHRDSFDKTRPYQITATADRLSPVSTPSDREIYVEHLIEQNRNSTDSISGPTSVLVGETYDYTLVASTAPGGYEQLEAFIDFPNVIFRIVSVETTYGTGGTSDLLYADACGWDNDPLSADYLSCAATGREGGGVTTVYTVEILSAGEATVSALIYDFSGSSFHQNTDYGVDVLSISASGYDHHRPHNPYNHHRPHNPDNHHRPRNHNGPD